MSETRIPLAKGKGSAVIDTADLPLVSAHWWRLDTNGYAATKIAGKYATMQSLLMGVNPGHCIDHKNRVRLDNRRDNLRWATKKQNAQNLRRLTPSASGFLGVHRRNSKWEARISDSGKYHYLGVFDTKEEAARVYDAAAMRLRGEFAVLNF